MIFLYTDGACSGNPGPGGWGALIRRDSGDIELSGGEKNTTNNKMELTAVIEGLRRIEKGSDVTIVTDSEYVKNGMTQWIFNWLRNNWKTASKQPVKNKELWVALLALTKERKITWQWVKGHSGHTENERCDTLARDEINKFR
ncbi:MAG: ribonuclease HI [Spirochaetia bacterium]|jgi:ribonuclease HI|nr:ribonuclease HI [Spirochaetia bacterium]